MTHTDIPLFETELRKAIERSDLAGAEALIRSTLVRARDPVLEAAVEKPLDQLRIAGWDNVAADMGLARRFLPEADRGREWGAVLLGLVNRNDVRGLRIEVAFTFDAEPDRATAEKRPSYMSEAQFEAWRAESRARVHLPKGPRHRAYPSAGHAFLEGLEELRALHDRRAIDAAPGPARDAIFATQSLAAAIVLLRYHQVVERALENPGLPRPLVAFVHVETASWPMESNTIDYGTQATRVLRARADRYDTAVARGLAESVMAEQRAALLAEVRGTVTAMRELALAMSLWPRGVNPEERRRFFLVAEGYLGSARAAVGRDAPGEAPDTTVEALCRRFAEVRLGRDDAHRALEPAGPEERTVTHRLSIAYARKFGGVEVSEALAHVPPPPEALLRTGDYGL